MELIDADKAIYGAVQGWVHGKQHPETFVSYAGSSLTDASFQTMISERYPSAEFKSHHAGDTLKLRGEDGLKFMAALGEYRDNHNIKVGLAR